MRLADSIQINFECPEGIVDAMSMAGVNGVVLRGAMLSATSSISGNLAPLSFFAPNCQIFSTDSSSQALFELKSLIKECHKRSMEVLLEV